MPTLQNEYSRSLEALHNCSRYGQSPDKHRIPIDETHEPCYYAVNYSHFINGEERSPYER